MANLFNRFLDYIGIEETDMEDEYHDDFDQDEQFDQPDNVVSFGSRDKRRSNSNVVSMPAASQMKVIVFHPISYEDSQNIIDNLKSRKPVIVNMEDLDIDCARRILDFMAGAVYALNGTIFRISKGIFMVAPLNYDIISNDDGELGDDGML